MQPVSEIFTLEFNDGKSLHVPKATLSLCGEIFKTIFEHGFQENQTRTIKFACISSSAFRMVLRRVETRNSSTSETYRVFKAILKPFWISLPQEEEYLLACDFLNFPCIREIAFGKDKWEKHFGDVGKEPPLPAYIHKILNADCSFFSGKKVEQTHMLMLIPATVNGKPYCFNEVYDLTGIRKVNEFELERYGEVCVPKSYWVLMTRDKTDVSKRGYEVPTVLEAATAILIRYAILGKTSLDPFMELCCHERMKVVASRSRFYLDFSTRHEENFGFLRLRRFF